MSIGRTSGSSYIVCTSSTRPTGPTTGMLIYETDTKLFYVWDGSSWVEVASAN